MRDGSPAARVKDVTRNSARYPAFGSWLTERRAHLFPDPAGQTKARAAMRKRFGAAPHPTTWSKWENGHALPGQEYMTALEKMFGADWPREAMPLDQERQMRAMLAEALGPIEEAFARQDARSERVETLLEQLARQAGLSAE